MSFPFTLHLVTGLVCSAKLWHSRSVVIRVSVVLRRIYVRSKSKRYVLFSDSEPASVLFPGRNVLLLLHTLACLSMSNTMGWTLSPSGVTSQNSFS